MAILRPNPRRAALPGRPEAMKRNPPARPAVSTLLAVLLAGLAIGRLSAPRPVSGPAAPSPEAGGRERAWPTALTAPPLAENPRASPEANLPTARSGWEQFQNQPPSDARDAEAARWLARHAARAPEEAIALALAEPHRARRSLWRSAALRGWAASAPEAAAAWIIRQPASEDRGRDIAASLAGAATTPANAFALAQRYAAAFPERAPEHGGLLIAALAGAGEFASAARFAASANEEQRDTWTALAFSRWSEQQPAAATAAASALTDPALRDVAWRAAVVNWAQNEPDSLADYAFQLPAGEARAYALGEALRLWIDKDVVRASGWLDRLDPSTDTDLAVSLIATHPALAAHRPDVALSWAESISEPTARSRTVARVVQVWADSDPAAAARYARTTPALLPADREEALPGERFTAHP